MTIVRVGATKKYTDGWEAAFGKGKKSKSSAATKKKAIKKKATGKASAKKKPAKKRAGAKKSAKKRAAK